MPRLVVSGPHGWIPARMYRLIDVVAAYRWAAANSARLGIDPARLAIGGASAGADLPPAPPCDCAMRGPRADALEHRTSCCIHLQPALAGLQQQSGVPPASCITQMVIAQDEEPTRL